MDFHIINCTKAILLVEVDENQHSWYNLPCEFSRMADVQASLAMVNITKTIHWIRYSSNGTFRKNGQPIKIDRETREAGLKKHIEYLCSEDFTPSNSVSIHYMYYNLMSNFCGPEIMVDPDFPDVLKEFTTWETI